MVKHYFKNADHHWRDTYWIFVLHSTYKSLSVMLKKLAQIINNIKVVKLLIFNLLLNQNTSLVSG